MIIRRLWLWTDPAELVEVVATAIVPLETVANSNVPGDDDDIEVDTKAGIVTDIATDDEAGLGEDDDTEAIDVDTDAEVLRVLECFVEVVTTPVMILPVDDGVLSGIEEPEADAEEELEDVLEADAEEELGPRWMEVIAKAGLAFPESPITGEVH